MAGASPITLGAHETGTLQKILRSRTLSKNLLARAQIILATCENYTNTQTQTQYGIEEHRVATWRNRFYKLWKLVNHGIWFSRLRTYPIIKNTGTIFRRL